MLESFVLESLSSLLQYQLELRYQLDYTELNRATHEIEEVHKSAIEHVWNKTDPNFIYEFTGHTKLLDINGRPFLVCKVTATPVQRISE